MGTPSSFLDCSFLILGLEVQVQTSELHVFAHYITTAPCMVIDNDGYNNDDDNDTNNTNNQRDKQSRQKDLLLGKTLRNVLITSPNPFNPQK